MAILSSKDGAFIFLSLVAVLAGFVLYGQLEQRSEDFAKLIQQMNEKNAATEAHLKRDELSHKNDVIDKSVTIVREGTVKCPYFEKPICTAKFLRYESSTWEAEWIKNIPVWKDNVCDKTKEQTVKAHQWADGAKYLSNNGSALFDPGAVSPEIFSRFFHHVTCDYGNGKIEEEEVMSWMEPLASLTRHPLFCENNNYLMSGDGFIPYSAENPMVKKVNSGNNLYMDAGAGLFNAPAAAGGISQQWFFDKYNERGIKWSRFIGWEAVTVTPEQIYKDVPGNILPVYQFFNIPCSGEPDSPRNPLNIIRALVKPNDFVVFKLDIDTSVVELPIVEQMMNTPEISDLIDEMYFEHHHNVKDMEPWWGHGFPHNIVDSYALFLKLRKMGVRMHSWF